MKRQAIRACLNVVMSALAMVMAGTGELNVLRRLRVAHGHFGEGVGYGAHLASHTSLGLLLLGQGRFTLASTDTAVAALFLAFFPVYPSTSSDNRAHLQAYRHLWTLAAEPRCLEARDVDTGTSVFLPLRLRVLEPDAPEPRSKQLVAPTLVPDLRLIKSVQLDSPRYWPFSLDLAGDPERFAQFVKNSTLWVKRKTGHLSYAEDPRGIRSIFTRSKSEAGSAVIDFGETTRWLSPSTTGLRDFVSSFTTGEGSGRRLVNALCVTNRDQPGDTTGDSAGVGPRAPSAFEAFSASVLLECLTRDKPDVAHAYLELFRLRQIVSRQVVDYETVVASDQMRAVCDFYDGCGSFGTLFTKPSKSSSKPPALREALLQPSFVEHMAAITRSELDRLAASRPSVMATVYEYLTSMAFEWPRAESTSARETTAALALYLRMNRVPDVEALARLRAHVCHAVAQANPSGGERPRTAALLTLRLMRSSLADAGWHVWTEAFERDAAEAWSSLLQ